jgi:protoheme IX farnesyltransferase
MTVASNLAARSEARPSLARRLAGLVELTKPRIVLLVLVTGFPALFLAARGRPDLGLAIAALAGTALAAMSAAAFNHYFDRDVDSLMRRTSRRPLPAGVLLPGHAIALGVVLGVLALVVLGVFAGPLAAAIGLASIVYYAGVYTVWLKRRTPQNIVIGGAAGASAPLIAWAALTGNVGWGAVLLASIVFMWTPPHFWALALYRREDYARAGIPMLPVTHGEPETRRQIVLYTWILVPLTLALGALGLVGPIYMITAALLGAEFLRRVHRLHRTGAIPDAVATFRYSIAYLFLLYLALTIDALVRYGGRPVS